jgi:hypothetical protein
MDSSQAPVTPTASGQRLITADWQAPNFSSAARQAINAKS